MRFFVWCAKISLFWFWLGSSSFYRAKIAQFNKNYTTRQTGAWDTANSLGYPSDGCVGLKGLTITGKRSASSIFHPTRFNGTNFLKKRFFRTVIDPYSKKKKKAYNGNAEVVISGRTPFILEYDYRNSHLNVSFYVQRYNYNDFAMDSQLQHLMNM